jgi:catechol 2,3-dioxygenase
MADPKLAFMDPQVDVSERIAFNPRRIGHMNLFVTDLESTLGFLHDVCGLEVVGKSEKIGAGFVSNGNTHHDVGALVATGEGLIAKDGHVQVPKGRGRSAGLNHIGWEMDTEADLVRAYERAVTAGLRIHRTVDHAISRSVYVFDPDGNLHEIYADTIKDWRGVFERDGLDLLTTGWLPGEEPPSAEPKFDSSPRWRTVPNAQFHAKRLARCTLHVRDFDRTKAFYEIVMGMAPVSEGTSPRTVSFAGSLGNVDITLIEVSADEPRGLHHYSFEVADLSAFLTDREAYLRSGAKVERSLDLPYKHSLFLRDQDDFLIELYAPRQGKWADADQASVPSRAYLY